MTQIADPNAGPSETHRDRFVQSIRRAATRVFGNSSVAEQLHEVCDNYEATRAAIHQERVPDAVVVAVVGPTGQGKTWLVQQFLSDPKLKESLPSGDRMQDATSRIFWIGPYPPVNLHPQGEEYIHCLPDQMSPLGVEYLLLDTPGATDCDRRIADLAREALSLASAHILVVRRDQLRAQVLEEIVHAGEGTLVVPVVSVVRERDALLEQDLASFHAAIRKAAPSSEILDVITVDDFDVIDDEPTVSSRTIDQIISVLRPKLLEVGGAERRQRARLAAAEQRFRESLHDVLDSELPHLTKAVHHLREAAHQLPGDVARSLVGSGGSLRAGIRSRLRLTLLTDTAAIWFPYKTIVGLLNLTHGAWDRLVLSLSGSLPSLISSAWTTAKNIREMQGQATQMQDAVRQRSDALVRDRLGPLIRRFQKELGQVQSTEARRSEEADVYLRGIDELQQMSQQILEEEIEQASIPRVGAQLLGFLGTLVFWLMLSGPIVSIYSGYFRASYQTLTSAQDRLEQFPSPEWSMMLTSIFLSVMPTAIFAMFVITFTQRISRVRHCNERIQRRHDEAIAGLQADGILRLEFDDPVLTDAELLVASSK